MIIKRSGLVHRPHDTITQHSQLTVYSPASKLAPPSEHHFKKQHTPIWAWQYNSTFYLQQCSRITSRYLKHLAVMCEMGAQLYAYHLTILTQLSFNRPAGFSVLPLMSWVYVLQTRGWAVASLVPRHTTCCLDTVHDVPMDC